MSAPVAVQRALLENPQGGWQAGTVTAIVAAAQALMTGARRVVVTQDVGDMWHYTVYIPAWQLVGGTYDDLEVQYPTVDAFETAYPTYDSIPNSLPALTAALNAQVPAGMLMNLVVVTSPSYDDVEAAFPTVDGFETALTTYDAVAAWRP